MFCSIDNLGYFISDAPFAFDINRNVVPYKAADGSVPDGMRKAKWTGTWNNLSQSWSTGSWVDEEAIQLSAELNVQKIATDNSNIVKTLEAIDLASIRSIREWIMSQPYPPQFLIDHETQAQTERAKLK